MAVKHRILVALVALAGAVVVACSGATEPSYSNPVPILTPPPPTGGQAATPSLAPARVLDSSVEGPSQRSQQPPFAPRHFGGRAVTATPVPSLTLPLSEEQFAERAFKYVEELSQGLGPRESATEQELAAAEYLVAKFEQFGYATMMQPFTVESFSRDLSGLTLAKGDSEEIDVIPLSRSGGGTVSGSLIPVGLAGESDIPEEGLQGNIALAERGIITFQEKVDRLVDAGAVGVVIYNNAPGNFRGTLLEQENTPVAAISQEHGRRLKALADAGKIRATLEVVVDARPSRNVIGENPGPSFGGKTRVVILGAHYDTVPDVPGANDNASGTAVLLTVAEHLASTSLPFTVRFIAFGSEEVGLVGSRQYVDSLSGVQREQIIAMLNFDSLGSGDRIHVLGSAGLTGRVLEAGIELGIGVAKSEGVQGGSSDHASFEPAGVPVIMFTSPNVSGIHTADDILRYIDSGLLGDAVRLALSLIESPDLAELAEEPIK